MVFCCTLICLQHIYGLIKRMVPQMFDFLFGFLPVPHLHSPLYYIVIFFVGCTAKMRQILAHLTTTMWDIAVVKFLLWCWTFEVINTSTSKYCFAIISNSCCDTFIFIYLHKSARYSSYKECQSVFKLFSFKYTEGLTQQCLHYSHCDKKLFSFLMY